MNFDRKVRFGEQLGFQVRESESAPFQSELMHIAQPIEFRNNFKAPKVNTSGKKGPALLSGKVKKGAIKGKGMGKKPQESNKAVPEFNLDTKPQKYFDPALDPKSKI